MTVAGSLGSARAGVPVAVARQPILDRDEVIRGYEPLYRPTRLRGLRVLRDRPARGRRGLPRRARVGRAGGAAPRL